MTMLHLNTRHAVYAGSFDPVTLGHLDIIRRGARVFERVTVGVGVNPDKQPLFSAEERVDLMRQVLTSMGNVDVVGFDSLTVDFVRTCGAGVMLRGVRTLTDIELEFTMTLANRALEPAIETVFLMASEKFTHISSSLIRQIARMGQSACAAQLREFVPEPVIGPLLQKYQTSGRRRM
jgi:pantetheine-phosphate adenylyltransferase